VGRPEDRLHWLRCSSVSIWRDWYRDDFVSGSFTNGASSLAEYVSRHARPERRRMIEALGRSPSIGFLEYDWSLNGTTAGRGVP
jgi:hypothetical protein